MVAAARAGVADVEHEFVGAEARQPRLFVQALGVFGQLDTGSTLTSITPGSGVILKSHRHASLGVIAVACGVLYYRFKRAKWL